MRVGGIENTYWSDEMSKPFVMSQDDAVELWNSASGDYFEAQLVDYAAKAINFFTDMMPGSASNTTAYECNNEACGWCGKRDDTVHPKHDQSTLLCPQCYETTEPTPSPISDQVAVLADDQPVAYLMSPPCEGSFCTVHTTGDRNALEEHGWTFYNEVRNEFTAPAPVLQAVAWRMPNAFSRHRHDKWRISQDLDDFPENGEWLYAAPPANALVASVPVAFDQHEVDHGTHIEIVPHYADDTEIDARRYRWLRDPDVDVALVLDKVTGEVPTTEGLIGVGYKTYEYRSGVELDAAIDKAIGVIASPASPAASVLTDAQRDALERAIVVLHHHRDLVGISEKAEVTIRALLAASMGGDRT
jgi:hypothetical protein